MSTQNDFSCSKCSAVWRKSEGTNCWSADPENRPAKPGNCPTRDHFGIIRGAFALYKEDTEDARMAKVAARVEGLGYQPAPGSEAINARWTRVEDTIAFAKLMQYKKIGIATCIGLLDETDRLAAILDAQGFKTVSVCCKSGSIDKRELGLTEEEKIRPNTFEPACNPVAQARLLNEAGTSYSRIWCMGG